MDTKSVWKRRALAAIGALAFGVLFFFNGIGVSPAGIEKDARLSQQIQEDWQVAQATSDSMAALLFYDENYQNFSMSVYVKPKGLVSGYFYRGGGAGGAEAEGVAAYYADGYAEGAYLSLNRRQVERIEVAVGETLKVITLDPEQPFAVILPVNQGAITFYDVEGNQVESTPRSL